jgi:hypothetical protein
VPQEAEDVVRVLVDERLHEELVVVPQDEVDHHLDRVLAAPRGEIRHRRIVPVDALHGVQVGVVGPARVGGGGAAALEHVVARLHGHLLRDQPAARRGVGEPTLLLVQRQAAHLPPRRQHVERQVGLEREDGVDRARGALPPHAGAGGGALVQVL